MKKATVFALAYVLAPQDRDEFVSILQKKNIETLFAKDKALLRNIDAKALSQPQRLLLCTYVHLYGHLRGVDLLTDSRLVQLRNRLGCKDSFASHVGHCLRLLPTKELLSQGSPIRLVLYPQQRVMDWATDVVYTAHRQGQFIEKTRIRGLNSSEYEHPLDKQMLSTLRDMIGFDILVRKFHEYGIEPLLRIIYTGSNIKVSEVNFPDLHDLLAECCEILDLDRMPELYIQQGFINAMTAGVERPIIVLDTGCLGLLSHDELMFIIGHELGHIKSEHALYHTMGMVLPVLGDIAGEMTLGLGALVASGINLALLNWARMSEFTADRAGLLCCQNAEAAGTVMMKLAGAPPKYYRQLKAEHFIQQAKEFSGYDTLSRNMIAKFLSILSADHPWTVMRCAELTEWIEAGEYDRVLSRKSPPPAHTSPIGVVCASCKTVNMADDRYCSHCGREIG